MQPAFYHAFFWKLSSTGQNQPALPFKWSRKFFVDKLYKSPFIYNPKSSKKTIYKINYPTQNQTIQLCLFCRSLFFITLLESYMNSTFS